MNCCGFPSLPKSNLKRKTKTKVMVSRTYSIEVKHKRNTRKVKGR